MKRIMLDKTYIVVITISVILFHSCISNLNEKNPSYAYDLHIVDTININIANDIPEIAMSSKWSFNNDYLSFVTVDESVVLYRFKFSNNSWRIFNLSHLSKYYINQLGGYVFINDSSILLDHYPKGEILLFGLKSGSILQKIKIDNRFGIAHNDILKAYFDNKKLILPIMYMDIHDKAFNEKTKLAAIFNKKTNDIEYFGNYPSIGMTNEPRLNLMIPDITFDSVKMIVSFRNKDSIYSYNYSTETRESKICKDNFVNSNTKLNYTGDEMKDVFREEFHGLYKSIIHDKHYYYRVSVSYPDFNGDLPHLQSALNEITDSRQVTVTVLNKKLDIVAQSILPNINENNCFVRNEKIYLRSNQSSESRISFIGYKVQKKQ